MVLVLFSLRFTEVLKIRGTLMIVYVQKGPENIILASFQKVVNCSLLQVSEKQVTVCKGITDIYNRHISDALHDLVPFLQFTKHEKHPWTSATFSNVAD